MALQVYMRTCTQNIQDPEEKISDHHNPQRENMESSYNAAMSSQCGWSTDAPGPVLGARTTTTLNDGS